MTRETKIGLIVGLAFIVVFAVILSHKGTQPRMAGGGDLGLLTDAGGSITVAPRTTGRPGPRPSEGVVPAAAKTGDSPGPAAGVDAAPVAGGGTRPTAVSPRGRADLPEMPGEGPSAATTEERTTSPLTLWLEGTERSSSESPAAGVVNRTAPTSPPASVAPVNPPEVKSLVAPKPAQPAPPPAEPGRPAPEIKPVIIQEYLAKNGDNLTKIAQQVYKRATPREIEAILSANKDRLTDPRKLRAGMKLAIPELPAEHFEAATFPPRAAGAERLAANAPTAPVAPTPGGLSNATTPNSSKDRRLAKAPEAAGAVTGREPSPERERRAEDGGSPDSTAEKKEGKEPAGPAEKASNHRWVVVREKDTYASLARRHLGSADRWKEIHDLNKAKYPDPAKLPTGAKIRLPASGASGGLSRL